MALKIDLRDIFERFLIHFYDEIFLLLFECNRKLNGHNCEFN